MTTSPIGDFLQARRARLTPADVGIRPTPGRRRVPGLRREELAALAGLSADYYIQLEQGRRPRASQAVLDALARALRLTAVERDHLTALAGAAGASAPCRGSGPTAGTRRRSAPGRKARQHPLQQLLDLVDRVPALVLDRRMDIVAHNAAAAAVFALSARPVDTPNGAREVFQHPGARERYPDWDALAEDVVAMLHLHAGRHPGDRRLANLVGELSIASEDFRRLWARHDVRQKGTGPARIAHPVVGELTFTYRSLTAPGSPDDLLMTYTYELASATDERLRLLLSWAAPDRARENSRPD